MWVLSGPRLSVVTQRAAPPIRVDSGGGSLSWGEGDKYSTSYCLSAEKWVVSKSESEI